MYNSLNSRVKYYPVNNRRYEIEDVCGSSIDSDAVYYFEILPYGAKDVLKVYCQANRRIYEVGKLRLDEFSSRKARRYQNASRDPREAIIYEMDGGWLKHQLDTIISQAPPLDLEAENKKGANDGVLGVGFWINGVVIPCD